MSDLSKQAISAGPDAHAEADSFEADAQKRLAIETSDAIPEFSFTGYRRSDLSGLLEFNPPLWA
jgi:hypothetical protein